MTAQQLLNSPSSIKRYAKLENARNVAYNRSVKPQSILMGDDGRYWVVSRAAGETLNKAGYEYVK
jgi:hypothetical protein